MYKREAIVNQVPDTVHDQDLLLQSLSKIQFLNFPTQKTVQQIINQVNFIWSSSGKDLKQVLDKKKNLRPPSL